MAFYKSIFFLFTAVVVYGICKHRVHTKPLETLQLTSSNSGNMVSALKGQKLMLTLTNPGDGGYQFDSVKYDSTILKLNLHKHIAPAANNTEGDFGRDAWQFTALQSGSSPLKVSASRPWAGGGTLFLFDSTISVK